MFQFIRLVNLLRLQRNEKLPSGNHSVSSGIVKYHSDIKEVYLYDYLRWDPAQIEEAIKRELGWQRPLGILSYLHFDCKLHHLVNYFYEKAIGASRNVDILANIVRAGRRDRPYRGWVRFERLDERI